MEKTVMLLVMVVTVAALCRVGEATVYMVGDSAGWTTRNPPNYTAWAVSKQFHVGDVLVFTYNKQYHNVMEVSKNDYKNCNASLPIVTYATGNDSVTLKHRGHYYFLCGVPGHCNIGQKVDIRIPKPSSAAPSQAPAASSPAPSAATGSTGTSPAPMPSPPKPNAAVATIHNALVLVAAFAAVSAGFIMH